MDSLGPLSRKVEKLASDPYAESFLLKDGSQFTFKRDQLYKAFALYYLDSLRHDAQGKPRSDVPALFTAISKAQDREQAMTLVQPRWREWRTDFNLKVCLDLDRLVATGEIKPFSWVEFIREHSPAPEDVDEH